MLQKSLKTVVFSVNSNGSRIFLYKEPGY